MPKNMNYDEVSKKAGASKMKTNQDGGSVTAEDSSAAGKQLEKNQAKEGAAKYKHGAADGHMKDEKKGAAKYKGAHDYKKGAAKKKPDANGNGVPDYAEDGVGAARMGYSQSFGAARMNGYAKGAAKVQDIMTNGGAAKYMKHGAADAGHRPDAHTHKTSGSYGLNPNSAGMGRNSLVGKKADNNLTITHDPMHKDLGIGGRLANSMLFDSTGSDDTYPGDHLNQVRRTGGSAGSVNRQGETKIGANFFEPKNKISTPTVKTGYVSDSRTGRSHGDGDTIFNDANQDGTMLGRGLSAVKNYFK